MNRLRLLSESQLKAAERTGGLSWDEVKERGKLSISMSSLEQLDELMDRLGLSEKHPS